MYAYHISELLLVISMICSIACTVTCIRAIKNNERDLQGIVCIQAILLGAFGLIYIGILYLFNATMEDQLRESFIPRENYHHLNTLRYQLYDQLDGIDWYRHDSTTPDFLGMYDLDTGTFTYYVKVKSFDILKK